MDNLLSQFTYIPLLLNVEKAREQPLKEIFTRRCKANPLKSPALSIVLH